MGMNGEVVARSHLADAALDLASRGFAVFPCSPDNKRPLVGESERGKGDAGLYRATRDAEQIRAWWREWPWAMIGVPTGAAIGAFVVDLDPKHGVTAEELLEVLRLKCGGRLPPCPMVHTPRGGLHLWFAMPAGVEIGNRTGFLPMCDIRGTGGYVIVPPSTRAGAAARKDGCDSKSYLWEEDADLDVFAPPEPPVALVLMAVSRDRSEISRDAPGDRPRPANHPAPSGEAGARERRYALAAFDDEIRSIQNAGSGTRNSTLNNAALKLGSLVAAGALSESVVFAALEDAAAACGLAQDDGLKSVRATIASGFRAGFAKPRDLSPQRDSAPRKAQTNPSHREEMPLASRNSAVGSGTPPSLMPPEDDDTRKVIRLKDGRLPEAVAAAETALIEAGPGPIYQRSGELVHIAIRPVRRSDGSEDTQEVVANVEAAALLEELAYIARFERFDGRNKGWRTVDPPAKLAEAYFGRRAWKLPNLHHLIATPTLRPDGSLLTRQGYDEKTGLYLTWELKGLRVSDRPTQDQAEGALVVLTDVFNGFPYADRDDADKAGTGLSIVLAGVIGAVLRPTLPSAPLIGVTAPKAGTGKSYLVDLISMIATGRRATCLVSGVKLEEFEKSLGAVLLASLPLLSLDNMVQPLAGQLICMALSQERIDMRVLGLSKTANLPTTAAMFATGNNLKLQGDLTRRALLCRLDARMERPEERAFECDLLTEVHKRRASSSRRR